MVVRLDYTMALVVRSRSQVTDDAVRRHLVVNEAEGLPLAGLSVPESYLPPRPNETVFSDFYIVGGPLLISLIQGIVRQGARGVILRIAIAHGCNLSMCGLANFAPRRGTRGDLRGGEALLGPE